MCPSSEENYCIYGILIFVTLFRWRLVYWLDSIQPADQTPPKQSDKYQCRVDTVTFSWWWAHGCPQHVENRKKYIKQVHLVGLICKKVQGCRSTKHTNATTPLDVCVIMIVFNEGKSRSWHICKDDSRVCFASWENLRKSSVNRVGRRNEDRHFVACLLHWCSYLQQFVADKNSQKLIWFQVIEAERHYE
jgi:hypothetical protein